MSSFMRPAFGIHVGNTSACLAIYKQDESKVCVEVIANNAGDRVTPAIVTLTENETVVGAACKSLMISRWNSTVTCNKRMLDKDTMETQENGERRVATEITDGELVYAFPLEEGTEYRRPSDIAECIYRSLYEIAKSAVHGDDGEILCTLLVPKHFSESARFSLTTAVEAAGWEVMHTINEPAAAILGYGLLSPTDKEPPPSQTVLVYRVGGRTCDATVIDLDHGMITVLDMEHSEEVGGKLLINTLTNYLADEFYRKYKLDPKESHRSLMKLTLAGENCLHVLSTIESANCFVESLCDGVDFSHIMSRARFESLLFPFLPNFARPLHTVLSRLKMDPDSINTVLLCGGPMKIPRLKKYITDIFQESCTKIVPLPNGINYDEILAFGAAHHAGYLVTDKTSDNYLPSDIDIPVLEFPLIIQVEGAESEDVELEVGLPLPVHRSVRVGAPGDRVTLTFTQSESPEITLRGEVHLEGLEDPTELELEIDSTSGIKVNVPEPSGVFTHHTVKLFAHPNLL